MEGKRGIIFGALDNKSIAWKVAEHAHSEGAKFVLTNAPIALRMGTINELAEKTGSKVISADAIGRFPDVNLSDSLGRLPGISIERDQGQARYVSFRGTPKRYGTHESKNCTAQFKSRFLQSCCRSFWS